MKNQNVPRNSKLPQAFFCISCENTDFGDFGKFRDKSLSGSLLLMKCASPEQSNYSECFTIFGNL